MTATIEISHTERDDRGRYWTETPGGEAELIYRLAGAGKIVIASTFVPREARGGGVAYALVKRAIDDARDAGRSIGSTCSYVDVLLERNPEWRALRA
ncbi:MAG: GNAT family N-acetyltransferase [Parvularculaceae bacterium]|nr:N-acetyltransferase [Parvularculaceae bacterium]